LFMIFSTGPADQLISLSTAPAPDPLYRDRSYLVLQDQLKNQLMPTLQDQFMSWFYRTTLCPGLPDQVIYVDPHD
jgi:hypothetical protein